MAGKRTGARLSAAGTASRPSSERAAVGTPRATGARLSAAGTASRPSSERAAVGTPRATGADRPLIGVVALQGGFAAHARVLRALGAEVREVRTPADLQDLDGLVWPGGESTTMTLGVEREGLADPLRSLVAAGTPVFGTCAGMIMLDRAHLGVLDIVCERNAFGRQVHSFEADLELPGVDGPPVRAVFIRAPWVRESGADVEVLAEVDGHPVAVRQGNLLAVSFHPELSPDERLHGLFLQIVRECRAER